MTGAYMIHIPYCGSGPALVDLVAGQVNVMFDAYGSSGPFIKSGKQRALAVTAAKRSESVPELPTLAELLVHEYCNSHAFTIFGGAAEIQLTLIAKTYAGV